MTALIDVKSLSVSYGKIQAVHSVDLELASGSIVTIVGPNGAGKTTLLNAIMGLLPSRGRVIFDGEDLANLGVESRVTRGIRLVPERRELFGELSVADNLQLGAYMLRRDRVAVAEGISAVYERFPRLAERRSQLASTLSGGERQMLALGRALVAKPRLLMLDEPSLGLAPIFVREIFTIISSLRSTGVSILLVEQNARAALETADYGYVLENGSIVTSGPTSALLKDSLVERAYLGH